MTELPRAAIEILERGRLCYLCVQTPQGPHATPVVFAFDGGSIWITTSRRSVKARAWRQDPYAAGMVRHGGRAFTFRGMVTAYDLLEPGTWGASLLRAPAITRAAARFTLKNARYFAGYARDARRIPLAWTPPARVLASLDVEDGAVLDEERGEVLEHWGHWGSRASSLASFVPDGAAGPRAPEDIELTLGEEGDGAFAVAAISGPAVLPVRWRRTGSSAIAVTARSFLDMAGVRSRTPASLVADRASSWRASKMRGVMLRGEAEVYLPSRVRAGREALLDAAGAPGERDAVVRLTPRSLVWWRGWTSDTVAAP